MVFLLLTNSNGYYFCVINFLQNVSCQKYCDIDHIALVLVFLLHGCMMLCLYVSQVLIIMNRLRRGRRLVDLVTEQQSSLDEQCVDVELDEITGKFRPAFCDEQCDSSGDETFCGFSDLESIAPSDPEFVVDNNLEDTSTDSEVEELLDERCGQITRKRKKNGRKKKRKSKGQADKSQWKRIKNSEARLKGEQYEGFQKDQDGKYQQTVVRPAKVLQNRCNGHTKIQHGGPQQQFECQNVTENERQSMFEEFWKMPSWDSRKVHVRSLVTVSAPQHRRISSDENSRKGTSFKYFLMLRSDNSVKRIHVCKVMFMRTLAIGQRQLRDWLTEVPSVMMNPVSAPAPPQPGNDELEEVNSIVEFFDKLPKVESHYCRSSTTKKYLEPIWNSVTGDLYTEYLQFCSTNNKKKYCTASFSRKFRELKLSIFKPRKDQCNKCIAFKNGNVAADEYANHLQRKEKSRKEKDNDKEHSETDTIVYTMDVQAVLLCPRMQASATYYKTKLKVHNYTHYNIKTKEVFCYLWHEGNGGLDSNVFASILIKHLRSELEKSNASKIILWSDGCCYQNRSVKLANALLELAIEKNVTIEQKYLEVGHTQMEVDSIHSSIERKLPPHREIYIPADYINIIKSARKDPYTVIFLNYTDFFKYDGGKYSSIRPGNKKGDPVVTDICALQYLPEGKIKYKLNFEHAYEYLPKRPLNSSMNTSALYSSPLPIEMTKFIHLQEMKPLIPSDYHSFYDSLKHNNCSSVECPHIQN